VLKKIRPFITIDTPLRLIPRPWLHIIEPRITRPKDTTCWCWDGATDKYGEPILNFYDALTGARTTRRVKCVVADMFWDDVPGHEVVHECGTLNCVNPWHFYISMVKASQEDRAAMIRAKQRQIRRYVREEKNA
jgi:hypothetical protein